MALLFMGAQFPIAQELTALEGWQIRPNNTVLKPRQSVQLEVLNCWWVDNEGADYSGTPLYDCIIFPALLTESSMVSDWRVNGVLGGNAQIGTIKDMGFGKATYTAPSRKPNLESLQVSADIHLPDVQGKMMVVATLVIEEELPVYYGTVKISGGKGGLRYSGQGSLVLKETGPGSETFTAVAGSLQIRFPTDECGTFNGTVPLTGELMLWTDEMSRSMRNGNTYDITFGSEPFEVNCHGFQSPIGTLILFNACDRATVQSDPEYKTLHGEGTCGDMVLSWEFERHSIIR